MDTKISGIRALFPGMTLVGKRSTDRDPNAKQEHEQRQERQPTEEEAKRALDVILKMESVINNGLQAALECIEGIFIIRVRNSAGQDLRGLRGEEILRLIEGANSNNTNNQNRGRILDRRI